MRYRFFLLLSLLSFYLTSKSQESAPLLVLGEVDFADSVRVWDGFGVNYVETSQTYDYNRFPQDYGGFSILTEKSRREIVELVFGTDGLRPSIVKMFLDPLHQKELGGAFDHKTTTKSMRQFAKHGYELTRKRGEKLSIITTLYSPPAYITRQNRLRGKDIREDRIDDMAEYMTDWVDFLRKDKLPVEYISIHNEGEDWRRWSADTDADAMMDKEGHDYNMYVPAEQVTKTINSLRTHLDSRGLKDIKITNGENTNWYRFWSWNYAGTIVKDKKALDNLGLITSHGFYVGGFNSPRWFAPHSNEGTETIRRYRPDLHAWTTSTAWNIKKEICHEGKHESVFVTNAAFLKEIHGLIYEAHCNAVIPWAMIQRASQWNKPDPNPGCAIRVYDNGTWEIRKGYYYYKQVTSVGRPGMNIAKAWTNDSDIAIIAFAKATTNNPNAFVVVNWGNEPYKVELRVNGSEYNKYKVYRTSGEEIYKPYESAKKHQPDGENYKLLPDAVAINNIISFFVPPMSATTFSETK